MNRLFIAWFALIALPTPVATHCLAQSMDDLNLQVHGYATQGFLYSTNNNWNTTNSTDGSAAWTEAVVNLSAQPQPKLRIGVQARYYLLGNYGNAITLDWAQADYKVNERLGFRVGKVKTPMGMLNETQDIDPANPWILFPQSVYPESSRNSILAHNGGVVYGKVPLGERLGTLDYHAFGGQRTIASADGFFQTYRDMGYSSTNGLSGGLYGGSLRWNTPIDGLTLGASQMIQRLSGDIAIDSISATAVCRPSHLNFMFGRYERSKFMIEGEYSRVPTRFTITIPAQPAYGFAGLTRVYSIDWRNFYAISSYKLADKLTAGLYYSSTLDRDAPISSARYQKDWALFSRYDFSPYLYLKVEQHFVDGTLRGFGASDNSSLKPDTRMTLLKLGVSF